MLVYIDASTLIKLIQTGSEADSLRRYLGDDSILITTRVALVEALRAHSAAENTGAAIEELLSQLNTRELDATLAERASALVPGSVGTADAIQIAAGVELRSELDAFVTYDPRLAEVARGFRLPVVTPG